jgi:hypothetical protein
VAGRLEGVDQFGRLVEFLPASAANGKALLAVFLQELEALDVMGADFYGYLGENRKLLEQAGFKSSVEHFDGAYVPTRFQPLDGKGGELLSAIFAPPDIPKGFGNDSCPWYWTKADSDQDRPN